MATDAYSRGFWINQTIIEGQRANRQNALANNLLHSQLEQDKSSKESELREEIKILKEDNEYYKKLLAKPMVEIAQENKNFKETYEKQMELLADWMVSQKAFKELAIQFGIEKGLTPDEVIDMGLNKKLDVLDNKNDQSHKTNSNTIDGIEQHIDSLKHKFHSRKKR